MKHTQKSLQNPLYKWHGETVNVEFGSVFVKEQEEKPMWWWNFECRGVDDHSGIKTSAIIEAVKVIQSDGSFVIANHFGIGIAKLLKGGWMNHTHFSLPADKFEAHESTALKIRIPFILEFDELGYSEHESDRRNWKKKEYPEEFNKMEGLRSLLIKDRFLMK